MRATQGVERHAFLGDYVGYGADPGWVVDRVREQVDAGAIAVLGNHDAAVVTGPQPSMVADARAVVAWTRARLDPAQLAFLAALPLDRTRRRRAVRARQRVGAGRVGLPRRRAREAVRSLQATDRRFTFCGHVHVPMLYHLRGTGKAGEFMPVAGIADPALGAAALARDPRLGRPAARRRPGGVLRDVRHRGARADLPPRPLRPRGRGGEDARRRPARARWRERLGGAALTAACAPASLEVGQVVDGFRLDALAAPAAAWRRSGSVSRVDADAPTPTPRCRCS